MKLFITVFLAIFIFKVSNSQKPIFKAITVIEHSITPSFEEYTDSNTIFYTSNIVIHKIHRHFTIYSFKAEEEGTMTESELIKSGEIVKYFVYNPEIKYGIMFNDDTIIKKFNYDTLSEKRVLVDSFLQHNNFNLNFNFKKYKTDSTIVIIDSTVKYKYIETYITKSKINVNSEDSVILYYNNEFMDIDYSLSQNTEGVIPLKLQKVRMKYTWGEDKLQNKYIKRERIFELRKVDVQEFEDAFKYYELAIKKL
jgi:hypothetical protein